MSDAPATPTETVAPTTGPESDDDTLPKEGIDFRKDGGIHLWIDGTKHRLRRPRGREFRKLREELQVHLDDINDLADEGAAWNEAVLRKGEEREKAGEPRVTTEERIEDRQRGRVLRDLQEQLLGQWWSSIIATLAVTPVEMDAEDLPPWLADVQQSTRVLDHWRSVPSLSGVR